MDFNNGSNTMPIPALKSMLKKAKSKDKAKGKSMKDAERYWEQGKKAGSKARNKYAYAMGITKKRLGLENCFKYNNIKLIDDRCSFEKILDNKLFEAEDEEEKKRIDDIVKASQEQAQKEGEEEEQAKKEGEKWHKEPIEWTKELGDIKSKGGNKPAGSVDKQEPRRVKVSPTPAKKVSDPLMGIGSQWFLLGALSLGKEKRIEGEFEQHGDVQMPKIERERGTRAILGKGFTQVGTVQIEPTGELVPGSADLKPGAVGWPNKEKASEAKKERKAGGNLTGWNLVWHGPITGEWGGSSGLTGAFYKIEGDGPEAFERTREQVEKKAALKRGDIFKIKVNGPEGWKIYVDKRLRTKDNTPKGEPLTTPATVTVTAGPRKIELSKEGYQDMVKGITVYKNGEVTFDEEPKEGESELATKIFIPRGSTQQDLSAPVGTDVQIQEHYGLKLKYPQVYPPTKTPGVMKLDAVKRKPKPAESAEAIVNRILTSPTGPHSKLTNLEKYIKKAAGDYQSLDPEVQEKVRNDIISDIKSKREEQAVRKAAQKERQKARKTADTGPRREISL